MIDMIESILNYFKGGRDKMADLGASSGCAEVICRIHCRIAAERTRNDNIASIVNNIMGKHC